MCGLHRNSTVLEIAYFSTVRFQVSTFRNPVRLFRTAFIGRVTFVHHDTEVMQFICSFLGPGAHTTHTTQARRSTDRRNRDCFFPRVHDHLLVGQ